MERRGGRPIWVPAWIAGPLAAVAAFFLLVDVRVRDAGRGEAVVAVLFKRPDLWFDPWWQGTLGVAALVLLLVAIGMSSWRPDVTRWRFVGTRFVLWWAAFWVLLAFSLAATWDLTGHVVESGSGGISWRFVAVLRGHPANVATAILGYAAALACLVASVGGSWHVWPVSASEPAEVAEPDPELEATPRGRLVEL
ncbi:MAG: hypothetical protein ACPGQL_10890 [Thermoplasmatota archaeon]